jgi:hypothetical protein
MRARAKTIAILRILNLGAKDWPPHADDRAAQRQSIRFALLTIRRALGCEGGHVHIGAYGVSVVYTHEGYGACSLSGYGLRHCHTALAAMVAGVPWVDTRPVRDVGALLGAPLVACGAHADPPPWGALSRAPLRAVFAYYRTVGADGRRARPARADRRYGLCSLDEENRMSAMAFDTLKTSKELKEAGFADPQAEALTTAIGSAIATNVATKEDVATLKGDMARLDGKVESVRVDLTGKFELLKWVCFANFGIGTAILLRLLFMTP